LGAPKNPERGGKPAGSVANDIPDEARARYERAVQLYNDGDAEGALVEFERAYKLAPTYRLLYNIGSIRMQFNDYAEALKAFEGYLAGGGNEIPFNRRTEVEKHIFALKSKVGTLLVVSNANGAEVSVDDVAVGTIPLGEGLVLNPGQRRITITRGSVTRSRVVSIAGQDTVSVELNLETPRAPLAAAAPPPMPAASHNRTPAYVLWGVTGALAVGATVVGILALDAMQDLDNKRNASPATRRELDDAASKMKTLSLTADILAGAALVAGGTALYFTLRQPSDERRQVVRARFSATGVHLEGQF
jgi:hypothetical protein